MQHTIIYFLRSDAPLYTETYFPDKMIEAFKKLGIHSYVFPKFLQEQAA